MTSKQKLGIVLSIGISVLFLYLALREVDFPKAFVAIRAANYWYLIPAGLVLILAFVLRGMRWRTLMLPIKEISQGTSFRVLTIGFMAVNLLPLRMGEFVRPYLIGKRENVSRTASLATVILERIFDVVSLLTLMTISLVYSSSFPKNVRRGGLALGVLVFFLVIFLYLLTLYQERVISRLHKLIKPISATVADKVSLILEKFITGLEVLKKGRHVFAVTLYSLAIWFVTGYIFWFAGLAFGFEWNIIDASFVVVVTALGILVPGAPGFVGTFQYFCILGLTAVNVTTKDIALSYSIVLNLLQFFLIVGLGFVNLWFEGISLSELKSAES